MFFSGALMCGVSLSFSPPISSPRVVALNFSFFE